MCCLVQVHISSVVTCAVVYCLKVKFKKPKKKKKVKKTVLKVGVVSMATVLSRYSNMFNRQMTWSLWMREKGEGMKPCREIMEVGGYAIVMTMMGKNLLLRWRMSSLL